MTSKWKSNCNNFFPNNLINLYNAAIIPKLSRSIYQRGHSCLISGGRKTIKLWIIMSRTVYCQWCYKMIKVEKGGIETKPGRCNLIGRRQDEVRPGSNRPTNCITSSLSRIVIIVIGWFYFLLGEATHLVALKLLIFKLLFFFILKNVN